MSAPKGNQFWKLADPEKIGRPRNFDNPKHLWEETVKYLQECDDNPLIKEETTTSDKGVYDKEITLRVPYTWEGLYIYLGICNLDYYKEDKEFSGILTHIGNIIRNQKYTGAAVGIFNANIIARDLGLKERTDHTTDDKPIEQVSVVFENYKKKDDD